jgi:hypothetical protein
LLNATRRRSLTGSAANATSSKLLVKASLDLRSQKLLDVLIRASKLLDRASEQSIRTPTVIVVRSKASFSLQPRPRQADVVSSRDVT